MNTRITRARAFLLSLTAAAAVTLAATPPAGAQTGSCCFTNFRYAGACRETPPPGGTCADILNYLNNLQSAGQAYCGGTIIRGGWTQVPCTDGGRHGAGPVEPEPLAPLRPGRVPVQESPPVVQPDALGPRPGEVASSDANLLQISGDTSDMLVLLQASNAWRNAFDAHDAASLAGLFTTDGTLVLPDGTAARGQSAIAETWKRIFSHEGLHYTMKNLEAASQGDLAYKLGTYTVTDADGTVESRGLFMEIWTRRDGVWQLHRQIFTRTAPTGEPSAG